MASEKLQIRIESILGGQSPLSNFAAPDQFRGSLGIDPALPYTDDRPATGTSTTPQASGLLRPVGMAGILSSVNAAPMWLRRNPKNSVLYTYDANGSVYSGSYSSQSGLTDLNDGGSASGNGCEYYDNYMYFARDTTIARYGPLDGSPSWTDDYWVTTLGKTKFEEGSGSGLAGNYPADLWSTTTFPNHVMHRHSDGRLYIADIVGNQGTLHYISTTKTTVEGDTDNGSTYNALQFGYGLWPTAIESYGSNLVIALYEGLVSTTQMRAKIAFWDTTSQNANQITWVEFPDGIVTAMKNVNGVLYVFSTGAFDVMGVRISRYIGGYTFEEVSYIEYANAVFPGAVDGEAQRLIFGTFLNNDLTTGQNPEYGIGAIMALGLQKAGLSPGLFCISRLSSTTAIPISLIRQYHTDAFTYNLPYVGWTSGINGLGENGIDGAVMISNGTPYDYSHSPSVWWSQTYRIGRPFKITKIRIPIITGTSGVTTNTGVSTNTIITPKIYVDDETTASYAGGTSNGLAIINYTNYPGKKSVVMRPENVTGNSNFWLELTWSGIDLAVVGLPITIEYEILED